MQLNNLKTENRFSIMSLKADIARDDDTFVYIDDTFYKKSLHGLLLTEPYFFLLDEVFLTDGLEISRLLNDPYSYNVLQSLRELPNKNKLIDEYLNIECFKRGYTFDYLDYLEMIELDDLLIKETDPFYVKDNPYIINSIEYLKKYFPDYYKANIKANKYLYDILTILEKEEKDNLYNLIAINSVKELFNQNNKAKIITFKRNQ